MGRGVPVPSLFVPIQVGEQVCCASWMFRGAAVLTALLSQLPALLAACWVDCFSEAGLPYDLLALWTLLAFCRRPFSLTVDKICVDALPVEFVQTAYVLASYNPSASSLPVATSRGKALVGLLK